LQKFHAHVTIWGDNNNNKTFESKVFAHLACLLFLIVGKTKPLRIWRDQL
jgi:hypothetical protein